MALFLWTAAPSFSHKDISRLLVVGLLSGGLAGSSGCANHDPYLRLARGLSDPLINRKEMKVAVLQFSDLADPKSPGGAAVAENLTTRLYRRMPIRLVERSLITRVFEEQGFSRSGAVSTDSYRSVGRLLGADAVVVGTLADKDEGFSEANARVIDLESGLVLAAASAVLPKTWGVPASKPVPDAVAPVPPSEGGLLVSPRVPEEQPGIVSHETGAQFKTGTFSGWGIRPVATGLVLGRNGGGVKSLSAGPPLPEARFAHGAAIWNGRLYIAGGDAGGGRGHDSVWSLDIRLDSRPEGWREENRLPEGRYQTALSAWNGRLFLSGGYHNSSRREVYTASLDEEGRVGAWEEAAPLPEPSIAHSMVAYDGRLYVVCGSGSRGAAGKAYSASISPEGHVGSWAVAPMPVALEGCSAAVADGRLYAAGGGNGGRAADQVLSAAVQDPDGRLGSWSVEKRGLPRPTSMPGLAAWNGRLYLLGGTVYPGMGVSSSIDSAPVMDGGRIGPWREESIGLPSGVWAFGQSLTAWDGKIIVAGGLLGRSGKDHRATDEVVAVELEKESLSERGVYYNVLRFPHERPAWKFFWKMKGQAGDVTVSTRLWRSKGVPPHWGRIENGAVVGPAESVEYRIILRRQKDGGSPLIHVVGADLNP